MIVTASLAVYALGLRHGADPDHLAAIDNMTRNSIERAPRLSRFVGALFAAGHAVMVIAIAGLVGMLGAHFAAHGTLIEQIGSWISVVVLVALAAVNIRQLMRNDSDRIIGLKMRLLPRALRNSSSPWLAVPVGLLFGFGFETSSQVAAYAAAFGGGSGLIGALVVGATFCLGMVCTDTLDSLLVHRLVAFRTGRILPVMRVWIVSVTACALGVAAYEVAQLGGWLPAGSELTVSAVLVGTLLSIFLWVFLSTRSANRNLITKELQ
jgi:nickel/cobalt transporter (NiCoT) family protein